MTNWRHPTLILIGIGISGCGLLFPGSGGAPDPSAGSAATGAATPDTSAASDTSVTEAPSPTTSVVTGTLLQEEVSITLRRGELQVRVTPLDESITRVTAPDTYERLSALARGHQEIFRERTGAAVPFTLVLVSLYTESTELTFEPEALNLVNRGLRYRPVDIQAVTPDWNTRRIQPREVLMAVYAFPREVDLERGLVVEYQELRSREWDRVLPVIQSERARLGIRSEDPR